MVLLWISREQNGRITSLTLLATLLLLKPRTSLAFWALSDMTLHCWLMLDFPQPSPQSTSSHLALSHLSTQHAGVSEIAITQVQDLAFHIVELHEVHTDPPLKHVRVPLDGIPSLQSVDCLTEHGAICKFAEAALNPTIHITGATFASSSPTR
ncbi:hypothetical protein HGM15179_005384 [Zosterops borbonicus]|uniref:Uncharacterized protein n=1 Tax=Zosterops borbonicus TaxID=364589 RepID=A0A8K1GQM2_9PASS|nr:hypothetical protein HGM15179_005384 [Zosterops borbonicus]